MTKTQFLSSKNDFSHFLSHFSGKNVLRKFEWAFSQLFFLHILEALFLDLIRFPGLSFLEVKALRNQKNNLWNSISLFYSQHLDKYFHLIFNLVLHNESCSMFNLFKCIFDPKKWEKLKNINNFLQKFA